MIGIMITPDEFLKRWDSTKHPLVRYNRIAVNKMKFPKETITFLTEAGMPKSVAPFLTFHDPSQVELLEEELPSGYLPIGATGNGDVICVRGKSGEIIIIDHEESSRTTYMNSSISRLLEFFLEYTSFIKRIIDINGKRAVLENNAPPDLVNLLLKRLSEIDYSALQPDGFWAEEIDQYRK